MINLQYEIKIYVKNLSKGTMKKLFTTHFYNFCNFPKLVFKILKAFLWIPQWKIKTHLQNMPHFKAFDKRNLQYEKSVCQILYNKGTITNTSWYPFKCNRR